MALSPLSIIIQVVAALIVIYVIYLLSLLSMRADKLFIDEKYDINMKRKTMIIDGVLDPTVEQKFNTITPHANRYIPLNPSVNIRGGAQFTYMFWIQVLDKSAVAGKPIFMKGDTKAYDYTIDELRKVNGQIMTKQSKRTSDLAVFCPMLSFGNDSDEFSIKFNSFNNMHEELYIAKYRYDDSAYRQNLPSMMAGQWFMITVIFEDNMPINDFENGLSVKFYLNDVLYQSATFPTAMKQNKGDLYIFPRINNSIISGCRISNFMYYNYAVSDKDITLEYNRRPSMTPASILADNSRMRTPMSDYNLLDMYNA